MTGLSVQSAESAGKRLDFLREVVPSLRHLAIMFDAAYPAAVLETVTSKTSLATSRLDVVPHGIKRAEDIGAELEALKGQTDALSSKTLCLVPMARASLRLHST